MDNKDILKKFVQRHNFSSEIDVYMKNGNTWDDVYSVVFNEKDLPTYRNEIPLTDIQFDVISDLPVDAFNQWVFYMYKTNEYKEFPQWLAENGFNVELETNAEMESFKKDVEESIDKMFNDFTNRNSKVFDAVIYDEKSEGN